MSAAKAPTSDLKDIRVVVFREGDKYVAQCIEYDIATQAADIDTVLDRLDLTLEAECSISMEQSGEPFAGIAPAPNFFHQLWEKGSLSITRKNVPIDRVIPKLQAVFAKAA
jgi:hypothetical protein